MPNDINELDVNDIGLKKMFGDRYHEGLESAVAESKKTAHKVKVEQKPVSKPQKVQESQWEPVRERSWKDDVRDCAKSAVTFGGLNMLLWYWQIAGLMDESIAVPSMLVCAALCGLGIGKVVGRKDR